MKIAAYAIILFLMILLVIFDMKNITLTTNYLFFDNTLKNTILPMIVTISFLLGIIAGIMYNVIYIVDIKKHNNAQNKHTEKITIDKDNAELKIKTLQSKVDTLEAALKKALNQ